MPYSFPKYECPPSYYLQPLRSSHRDYINTLAQYWSFPGWSHLKDITELLIWCNNTRWISVWQWGVLTWYSWFKNIIQKVGRGTFTLQIWRYNRRNWHCTMDYLCLLRIGITRIGFRFQYRKPDRMRRKKQQESRLHCGCMKRVLARLPNVADWHIHISKAHYIR